MSTVWIEATRPDPDCQHQWFLHREFLCNTRKGEPQQYLLSARCGKCGLERGLTKEEMEAYCQHHSEPPADQPVIVQPAQ